MFNVILSNRTYQQFVFKLKLAHFIRLTSSLCLILSVSHSIFAQQHLVVDYSKNESFVINVSASNTPSDIKLLESSLDLKNASIEFVDKVFDADQQLKSLQVAMVYTCSGEERKVGGKIEFVKERNLSMGLIYVNNQCDFGVISAPTNSKEVLMSMFFKSTQPDRIFSFEKLTPIAQLD